MNPFAIALNFAEAKASWLGEGGKAVPQKLADQRTVVCLKCPKNQPHPIYENLTRPVADNLRHQIELKSRMKLKAQGEDGLHICEVCWCVLSLKVWSPIQIAAMNAEITKLPEWCWVREEACLSKSLS